MRVNLFATNYAKFLGLSLSLSLLYIYLELPNEDTREIIQYIEFGVDRIEDDVGRCDERARHRVLF